MLIGFKFQNFRSFLTEQTFSFSTSSDRTHESTHLMRTGMKAVPRVSKAAIVFGPNASGKTNMLIALATFRDLILHSTAYSDAQFAERHTPFRFGPSISQATEFEIDVLLDQVRYRYAMSYDSQRVRSERLLVYRTGKSQRWFERHFDEAGQKDQWAPFSPNFNGPREMWRKATRPRALFLTTAAQLNSEQLAPLLRWVEHRLEVVLPADMSDVNRVATRIQDADFKARVIGLLRAVDIHVDDVRVAEQDLPHADQGTSRVGAAGYFKHGGARTSIEFLYAREGWLPIWLDSMFEAAGTQRLVGLFGPLLQAIENGKLLLIDEFDSGLHPLVARYLIQLINDPTVSSRGAQLLLTSHNTTLMDLEILRRDEIWLVELNERHASNLSPLLRSSPRKHELIAKNYLRGRYGAVPLIRSDDTEAPDAVGSR
ncbi:MAG TPA: ATP-binding protein [Steroidobacteraceae bacterium]|nr:ATP-binding protein [Steroidobacteraceae bacterium]